MIDLRTSDDYPGEKARGSVASNAPGGPVLWALTPRDLEQLVEDIHRASEVVMDLETTGLDEHAVSGGQSNGGVAARVSMAALTLPRADEEGRWDGEPPRTWVLPLSHPRSPFVGAWRAVLRRIAEAIRDARRPWTNANVKFDARWVYATTGVDLHDRISWDTQVSSHLLDENASTRLKDRAPETFGIPPWDDHDLSYPGASEDVDLWELGEYAARDTWWTWRLAENHRRRLYLVDDGDDAPLDRDDFQRAQLGKLASWIAMPTVAALTSIEQRGFKLDVPWVRKRLADERMLAADAMAASVALVGLDEEDGEPSFAPTSGWFARFTERAVAQGQLRVTATTPTGKPQWSKEVLGKQARQGSELAGLILEQRGATKRSEYLTSWLEHATPEGFIHSTYWPGRVVSGRLSSTDPNMQQCTKQLRPAFIPREGYYIADWDYSQIELRVAAFISRSEPMLRAFHEGADLHRLIAARVTGKRPEDVTPQERQRGKASNFGLLYMQSAGGFRFYAENVYGVEMSEEEAVASYEAFFDTWAGMREWHQGTISVVHRDGEVVSPLGRVRRLPGVWDGSPGFVQRAEKQAVNSPVQGFAADLLNLAAASITGVLAGHAPVEGARLVATVHDSLVGEVPIDRWEEVTAEVISRMETIDEALRAFGVELDVPLVAEATVGTRWGLSDVSGGD